MRGGQMALNSVDLKDHNGSLKKTVQKQVTLRFFLINGSPPPISELTMCAQKPCVSPRLTPRIRRKHREILNKTCVGFESVLSQF